MKDLKNEHKKKHISKPETDKFCSPAAPDRSPHTSIPHAKHSKHTSNHVKHKNVLKKEEF